MTIDSVTLAPGPTVGSLGPGRRDGCRRGCSPFRGVRVRPSPRPTGPAPQLVPAVRLLRRRQHPAAELSRQLTSTRSVSSRSRFTRHRSRGTAGRTVANYISAALAERRLDLVMYGGRTVRPFRARYRNGSFPPRRCCTPGADCRLLGDRGARPPTRPPSPPTRPRGGPVRTTCRSCSRVRATCSWSTRQPDRSSISGGAIQPDPSPVSRVAPHLRVWSERARASRRSSSGRLRCRPVPPSSTPSSSVDAARRPALGRARLAENCYAAANAPMLRHLRQPDGTRHRGAARCCRSPRSGPDPAGVAAPDPRWRRRQAPSRSPPPQGHGRPTYDWRELQRWGISEARLPAGSVVRFGKPGVWDQYRAYIVAAACLLAAAERPDCGPGGSAQPSTPHRGRAARQRAQPARRSPNRTVTSPAG